MGPGASTERGRGGGRGLCRPPRRRRASFPPSGSAPDSSSPWGRGPAPGGAGEDAGSWVAATLPRPHWLPSPLMPTYRKRSGRRRCPLQELEDWVSEETTKPSMQSGMSRGQAALTWRKWKSLGWGAWILRWEESGQGTVGAHSCPCWASQPQDWVRVW